MKINSKQTIFSILAGATIGLLMFLFVTPAWWGPVAGVLAATYFAKISTAKAGAMVGAIVLLPIGVSAFLQSLERATASNDLGIPAFIILFLIVLVSACGIGAIYGFIIGKLFQLYKDKTLIS